MPNVTTVLNEQIRRLARREITRNTKTTRKLTAQYRRDIAALKRLVTKLARDVAFLEKQERRRASGGGGGAGGGSSVSGGGSSAGRAEKLRFRPDGMKSHRARLGLSAADYGRLVGVSGLTIYHWESRKARPRAGQLPKLAAVRGLGKREALRRLELMGKG